MYLSITMGISLIVLALIEDTRNGFTRVTGIYGRVAFFYYVVHLYVIHIFSSIAFLARGHTWSEGTNTSEGIFPFYFLKAGEGYDLGVVYLVWIGVVVLLYPFCKWYDGYKSAHREKRCLSYL